MSSAVRTSRVRRGRVLIVGQLPDLARLTPLLVQPPLVVPNLFDALGEIAVAPVGQPITAVLLAERALPRDPRHAIEAIRKLDPSVRIVLVSESAASSNADWLSRGIDECIAPPIRPEDLARLFDEDMLNATPGIDLLESAEPAAAPAPKSAPRPSTESKPPVARPQTPAAVPRSSPAVPSPPPPPVIEIIRPQVPAPIVEPAAPTLAEPLGDTDLVEAILAGNGTIRTLAMRLMIQQTGWDDASLAEVPPVESNARTAGVIVTFRGYDFGHLSATASTAQLQPWADWLARWLALDAAHHGHRLQLLQDELTGSWNRRFFQQFLSEAIARAAPARRPVTIMVFDIDNFKSFNDRFGHEAGDEILRQTVALLNSVIRQGDRVCRIGGDEFVVIFADPEAPRKPGSAPAPLPETVDVIARRFQDQICRMHFPKLGIDAPGNLSISAGLATYPWDGSDAASLLRHADQLALESKRKGKNAITLGPGTQQACRRDA